MDKERKNNEKECTKYLEGLVEKKIHKSLKQKK